MGAIDPFGKTPLLKKEILETLVARFDERSRHPFFSNILYDYLDAMQIDKVHSVLDLGCGTGLVARSIVHRPSFSGTTTGVDISPYLVAAAQRLACEEGIAKRTSFRIGDVCCLEVEDESFHAVVAHMLLSHVVDPLTVLKETARVLRAGGMVGIFDCDYASLTFGHKDPIQGMAYDQALVGALVNNPYIMRQMPRLLQAAGLEFVTSFSYVLSEVGTANFWSSTIKTYKELIFESGVMTREEADAWTTTLLSDSKAGIFFGSCNYYAFVAKRRAE